MRKLWLLLLCLHSCGVHAAAVDLIPEEVRTTENCESQLPRMLGQIAHTRWHTQMSEEEFLAIPYMPGVPQWKQDLGQALISEAYAWTGTEESWTAQTVAACKETHV